MVYYGNNDWRDYLLGRALAHHGIKGQKWGVRRGPPYPLKESNPIKNALSDGSVSKKINREKQNRHTLAGHSSGRSYLFGDLAFAQRLIDKLAGTGEPVYNGKGEWTNKERVRNDKPLGKYVNSSGQETLTRDGMIVYSATGSHIYPRKEAAKDGTSQSGRKKGSISNR